MWLGTIENIVNCTQEQKRADSHQNTFSGPDLHKNGLRYTSVQPVTERLGSYIPFSVLSRPSFFWSTSLT